MNEKQIELLLMSEKSYNHQKWMDDILVSFKNEKRMFKNAFNKIPSNNKVDVANIHNEMYVLIDEKSILEATSDKGYKWNLLFIARYLDINKIDLSDNVKDRVLETLPNSFITQSIHILLNKDVRKIEGISRFYSTDMAYISRLENYEKYIYEYFNLYILSEKQSDESIWNVIIDSRDWMQLQRVYSSLNLRGSKDKNIFINKYKKEIFEIKTSYEKAIKIYFEKNKKENKPRRIELDISQERIDNQSFILNLVNRPEYTGPTTIDFLMGTPTTMDRKGPIGIPRHWREGTQIYIILLFDLLQKKENILIEDKPVFMSNITFEKYKHAIFSMKKQHYLSSLEFFLFVIKQLTEEMDIELSSLGNKNPDIKTVKKIIEKLSWNISDNEKEYLEWISKFVLYRHTDGINARNNLAHLIENIEISSMAIVYLSIQLLVAKHKNYGCV